jgi:hypothetical protein
MDKAQTIHIVSEIAVLTLMYLHFDKKVKSLQAELDHVKKTYVSTFDYVYQKIDVLKQGILFTHKNINQSNQPSDVTNVKTPTTENIQSSIQLPPSVLSVAKKDVSDSPIKQVNFDIIDFKFQETTNNQSNKELTESIEPKIQVIEETPDNKIEEEISDKDLTEIESIIENHGKTD